MVTEKYIGVDTTEKDGFLSKALKSVTSIGEASKDDYAKHPTYSFRGLHENMILGHLGKFEL